MKNITRFLKVSVVVLLATSILQSCSLLGGGKGSGVSSTTGAAYGSSKDTLSFSPYDIQNLPNPPGMVFVQGGRTILGSFEQDLFGARDNIERTVTVNSFYMDETEVTNKDWKEYVYYQFHPMVEQMGKDTEIKDDPNNPFIPAQTSHNGQELADLVPNDSVWASDFSFNDVYSQNYYSNPGFNDYPVVGVSWRQVVDYCAWRTNIVNYTQIISAVDFEELPDEFKLEFYNPDGSLQMLGASASNSGTQEIFLDELDQLQQDMITYINQNKKMFIEKGLYLPEFRLPNEAEWEYAAKATVGTQYLDENEEYGRIYPWDGRGVRNPYGKRRGDFLANFKRGRGDYAGIAGTINNDSDVIPSRVGTYEPNDFGLFNMGGNVSEWVNDTYRPLSFQDFEDLNPVRKDGTNDPESNYGWAAGRNEFRSLINNRSKVYKGGSWKDVAYWMSPGTRRYLDQDKATNTLGFRCAMISVGFERLDSGGGLFGGILGGK